MRVYAEHGVEKGKCDIVGRLGLATKQTCTHSLTILRVGATSHLICKLLWP